jgi:DNA-binding SARP family transcriptional activator/tetratricopeptide (TPR) repeat protein
MRVRIRLLGSPEVDVDGVRVVPSLRKAEGLLYYVAAEGRVGRERLAALLWGDRDEESAHNNLRNALYLIRRALPEGILACDRRYVFLRPDQISLDLDDLDRLGDPAASGWKDLCGEFLEGFDVPESEPYADWLRGTREGVRKRVLEGLRRRAGVCFEEGNSEGVESALGALLELDPYDEDSTLELLECQVSRGNLGQAFDLFRSFRARLREELNLAPSSRAEEVFRRLLLRGDLREIPSPERPLFFGRREEIGRVLTALKGERVRPLGVHVWGEAGVGKTALVRRVLSDIASEEILVLCGRAFEVSRDHPFSPWNDLLGRLGRSVDLDRSEVDPLRVSLLAGTFPNMDRGRRRTTTFEHASLFPEVNPVFLGETLAELLDGLSERRRLVLFLEDLQWFDDLSLGFLDGLMAHASRPWILFATSRLEGISSSRGRLRCLAREGAMELLEVPLKAFDPPQTLEFCRALLDEGTILRRGKESFYRQTQGIPLLVVELARALRENSGGEDLQGLAGILAGRYGDLSGPQKEFLDALAVFGEGASLEDLGALQGGDVLGLARTAESLLRKGLVEEGFEEGQNRPVLRFHHQRIREYVYGAMAAFKRQELHRRAAERLERVYSPQSWNPALSARLFLHFDRSGQRERELDLRLREMRLHIILNHELFPLLPDSVLLSCSAPFSDRPDTEQKLDQVRELLHHLNRFHPDLSRLAALEASYLELRGGYLIAWGSYKEGRHFLDRSLRLARKEGLGPVQLRCLQHLCYHGLQTDQPSLLVPHGREMLRMARELGRDASMGAALRFLGVARQLEGDFPGAGRIFERSIEVFRGLGEVGNPHTLGELAAENYIGELFHWSGRLQPALERFESCAARCEERGLFWGCSLFHSNAAGVALDLGDRGRLERHVERATELFERCQGGRSGSMLYSLKALVEAGEGRYAEALTALERGELLCAPIRKKSWSSVHLMAKALLAERMTGDSKAREVWGSVLDLPAETYAREAAEMFEALGARKRADTLRGRFHLTV